MLNEIFKRKSGIDEAEYERLADLIYTSLKTALVDSKRVKGLSLQTDDSFMTVFHVVLFDVPEDKDEYYVSNEWLDDLGEELLDGAQDLISKLYDNNAEKHFESHCQLSFNAMRNALKVIRNESLLDEDCLLQVTSTDPNDWTMSLWEESVLSLNSNPDLLQSWKTWRATW